MDTRIFTHLILESLDNYWNLVEQTGYVSYDKVNGILALMLVDDFLNTELSAFVDEKDYNIMMEFLYCIYGRNCLVPYPEYKKDSMQIGSILPKASNPFRITQDSIYRPTQSGESRTTESGTKFWD